VASRIGIDVFHGFWVTCGPVVCHVLTVITGLLPVNRGRGGPLGFAAKEDCHHIPTYVC
jgi:hypothetical protein